MREVQSIVAASLLASLVLTSCSASETSAPDSEEAAATATAKASAGDTSTATITTENGTATMRSGPGARDDLPLGFRIYPGAEVSNSTSFAQDGNTGALITFTSTASSDELIDFYRTAGDRAGFDRHLDVVTGGARTVGGKRPDGSLFSFSTVPQDDGTVQGQLSISAEN